eukprot:scaffold76796_cov32-Tisochrysis_lutea.AAC.3
MARVRWLKVALPSVRLARLASAATLGSEGASYGHRRLVFRVIPSVRLHYHTVAAASVAPSEDGVECAIPMLASSLQPLAETRFRLQIGLGVLEAETIGSDR